MGEHDVPSVLIVGGGFAGLGCAHRLARKGVDVTLVDKNDHHQFQPLLYQLATAQIGLSDVAAPLRGIFEGKPTVRVVTGEVTEIDARGHGVTLADGTTESADVLVLAAGATPNFFGVPGAQEHALPLYSTEDAERLRSHLLGVIDAVDRDPSLADHGGLQIVIVGGGATGVETAGALHDVFHRTVSRGYRNLPMDRARITIVDHGEHLLNGFTEHAHAYAARVLSERGVELRLGTGVEEVGNAHVTLSDGTRLATHTVVWAGGEKPAEMVADAGLPTGRGGRVDVQPDLTVEGFPGVYVVGDVANIPGADGQALPQLGSVAQQSGRWAAKNILAEAEGKPCTPFHYLDKGIMAMIGRNAAVAEIGPHRHEVDGPLAFAAWLGVHATLLEGVRQKVGALMTWGWDYVSDRLPHAIVDRPDAYVIDWSDDPEPAEPEPASEEPAAG